MDDEAANPSENGAAARPTDKGSVFYDGKSSRRHHVHLAFTDKLEITEAEIVLAAWPFAEIRRADGAGDILRLSCTSAPQLARLEIRDVIMAAAVTSRCSHLDDNSASRHGVGGIIGWSLAAVASIAAVIFFALPLAADRLAPLVPNAMERRIGDAAEGQIRILFGNKTCNNASGQAAFDKLMNTIGAAADIKSPIKAGVLGTPIPNAFALPGDRVYLFGGLLDKAKNPDEIAGVLAHELGHVRHRDNMRNLIYSGGVSFLAGLLFGDITGSGALIFASRSLITASYTREAEQNADDFAIDVMHRLGRPTKPMGELIFRITGNQADKTLTILANHPLTEDRLKHFSEADRPASGAPLLNDAEWTALKAICKTSALGAGANGSAAVNPGREQAGASKPARE